MKSYVLTLTFLLMFGSALSSGATLLNKGVQGQNSSDGKARFEHDVLANKPDVVIIYFGLNDTLNEPKFVSEDTFIGNLEWMIDLAQQNNITPILCTIHHPDVARLMKRHKPESYSPDGPIAKVDRYNDAIRALAARKNIRLADFCTDFEKAGGANAKLSVDGVHLTARANKILAATFYQALLQLSPKPSTIVCFGDSVTFGYPSRGAGSASGKTYPAYLKKMLAGQGKSKRKWFS